MSGVIISGKVLAKEMRETMKSEVEELKKAGIIPGLTVILVGNNPASLSYVKAKRKACQEVGMYSELIHLPESTTQDELLGKISELNKNPKIHGILVQLPLPEHIEEKAVIAAISPYKDVDGFHPINVGNMVIGDSCFLPCTPHGIIKMIEKTGIEISGKHAVVIGRSNIVGKPVSLLLLQKNATVTICHSRTNHLKEITRRADILIAAVGRPKMITKEYVSPGAIVIDVGVNRIENGTLVGDVDFEEVRKIASYITPVPGGVGPMTITMLLSNTIKSAKQFPA
ncbi:bifunctional methylenetetrahydrofolate dehydrogenase/methenyltetrahydrofolate cyclohydrolase FolD [Microaerobacter geothermalis]|uniref:bifunctional methylenetetrahydrofolate dehydrogenase/methenyltetrahydrofolate cyclohydrolase FolD n=1 Tax=Microaerobacter geothermalis TaxID=674972 RepID=UPI001F2F408E|nr:bifunctional methylenetetrahydrofolate dehydrogenase/methenyltetrahydrofolate cyclohydrolase FolD [Microaerobacter geothermalis]MCF6094442.1 bifunctional methylenetetrahydrofolate dehydrogenase/methenyltetrahydrofolate cyclohydrolase FolD [Microaerobacter geothermalis]